MPKRLVLVLSLLAAAVLLAMLNFTTPAEIGPFGVLVFFTSIYFLMFGVASIFVRIFTRLSVHQTGKKIYFYSAMIAFGPIMLLLAQSLGSLSVGTVILAVAFVLLSCFLISKKM